MSFSSRLRSELGRVSALRLFDYPKGGPRLARLDCNESPLPIDVDQMADFANALTRLDLHRYPDVSGGPLRAAFASQFGVASDQILLGNGSVECISVLMTALGGGPPGADAKVVFPDPSFPYYEVIARTHGLVPIPVPLDDQFRLDEAKFAHVIERERPVLALVASPNNPTGNRFDEGALVRLAERMDGALVVDEAYADFTSSTMLPRIGTTPSLFVLRSLSKIGLAGLRIGALVGPREAIAELDKVRLPWNINAVSLAIACAALARPERFRQRIQAIVELRKHFEGSLGRIPGLVVYPSEANFILVRTAHDADRVAARLLEDGVLVKNVSRAGTLEGCLRITVGRAVENERCLRSLRAALG